MLEGFMMRPGAREEGHHVRKETENETWLTMRLSLNNTFYPPGIVDASALNTELVECH